MGKQKDIENVIHAWKADEEEAWDALIPAIPVGEEISDQDLEEIVGGCCTRHTTCSITPCRNQFSTV